ncbi:hypothetical protein ACFC26_36505 [Kitasatospora purpeofusca]|uniref:hypothetical protein n=1 Tax=Kitasatospora purpeofusca TaxID=67352 RepID=UPI0035E0AA7C
MNQVLQQRIDAVKLLVPAAARRHLDALRAHADAVEEIVSYRRPLPDEGVRLGSLGRQVTTERVLAGFDAALLGYREVLVPN